MIKYYSALAMVFVLLFLISGCGSIPSTTGMERDQIIQLADNLYETGKWSDASFIYSELMFRYPGDAETDYFLYRNGLVNREQKLWADAEFYFYRVTNEFPRGVWADDAKFALAETMWMQRKDYRKDQTQVIRAREEIQSFLEIYPASQLRLEAEELLVQISDHLALRSLFIGRFYTRRNEIDAALLYLRDALDNYGVTSCRGSALLAIGDLYRSAGNNFSAKTYYNRAVDSGELSDDELEKALERLMEVQ